MDFGYKTVLGTHVEELTVKKSRFISHISPAKSEKDAFLFIDEIKKKHRDARHNVWAFHLKDGGYKRFSDDKEPKGTAGIHVLDVILKQDVKDVCIVVTRYFGGVLLGSGGLIRAYSGAASMALSGAIKVDMGVFVKVKLESSYGFYDILQNFINLHKEKVKIKRCDYGEVVEVIVLVVVDFFDFFKTNLFDISGGKILVFEMEKVFDYIEC